MMHFFLEVVWCGFHFFSDKLTFAQSLFSFSSSQWLVLTTALRKTLTYPRTLGGGHTLNAAARFNGFMMYLKLWNVMLGKWHGFLGKCVFCQGKVKNPGEKKIPGSGLVATPKDFWEANTANFLRGPMASMARADSQPSFCPDAYLQERQHSPLTLNGSGLTLSGKLTYCGCSCCRYKLYFTPRDPTFGSKWQWLNSKWQKIKDNRDAAASAYAVTACQCFDWSPQTCNCQLMSQACLIQTWSSDWRKLTP